MKKQEFEFIELVINRPGMFGIRDAISLYALFNAAKVILAIHGHEDTPIINCFFKFQTFCEKLFNLYKESPLTGVELIEIYCNFYAIDEYKIRKYLMAQFLKNEFNHEVNYEYETFEIKDVTKPFKN